MLYEDAMHARAVPRHAVPTLLYAKPKEQPAWMALTMRGSVRVVEWLSL